MKQKELITIIAGLLIVLSGLLIFLVIAILDNNQETTTSTEYTYTKAICTEDNFCQDYVIICDGQEMLDKTPIDGATAQFPKTWNDPRSLEAINSFCLRN